MSDTVDTSTTTDEYDENDGHDETHAGVHVNEHLPEDHRDHVTSFGDVRDKEHVPPGNMVGTPVPTQRELQEANIAVEKKRGTLPRDDEFYDEQGEDEDLIQRPHQGASSWWSDPDAKSSDITQQSQPGYGDDAEVTTSTTTDEVSTSGTEGSLAHGLSPDDDPDNPDATYNVHEYTVEQVVAYAQDHPEQVDDLLAQEQSSANPRTSLITKLEAMKS